MKTTQKGVHLRETAGNSTWPGRLRWGPGRRAHKEQSNRNADRRASTSRLARWNRHSEAKVPGGEGAPSDLTEPTDGPDGLMDARTGFTREAGAGILLAEGLGRGLDEQLQVLEQGGRQDKRDFRFSYLCFCSLFPKVDWSPLDIDFSGKVEMGGSD